MGSRVAARIYRSEDQDGVKRCIIELQDFERALEADRLQGEQVVERNFQELQEAHHQNTGRMFVAEVEVEETRFVGKNTWKRRQGQAISLRAIQR